MLLGGCQSAGWFSTGATVTGSTPSELSAAVRELDSVAAEPFGALSELLRYGSWVRQLDAQALRREYQRLAANSGADPAGTSIKRALLLSTPGSALYDLDAARAILAVVALEPRADALHQDLATLLFELLDERAADRFQAERVRLAILEQALREQELALDAERAQRLTLERQLQALRAIEDQINRRAESLPVDQPREAQPAPDGSLNGAPQDSNQTP